MTADQVFVLPTVCRILSRRPEAILGVEVAEVASGQPDVTQAIVRVRAHCCGVDEEVSWIHKESPAVAQQETWSHLRHWPEFSLFADFDQHVWTGATPQRCYGRLCGKPSWLALQLECPPGHRLPMGRDELALVAREYGRLQAELSRHFSRMVPALSEAEAAPTADRMPLVWDARTENGPMHEASLRRLEARRAYLQSVLVSLPRVVSHNRLTHDYISLISGVTIFDWSRATMGAAGADLAGLLGAATFFNGLEVDTMKAAEDLVLDEYRRGLSQVGCSVSEAAIRRAYVARSGLGLCRRVQIAARQNAKDSSQVRGRESILALLAHQVDLERSAGL